MRCFRALAFIAVVGSLAAAAPVHAQGNPDPIPYALTSPPSDFEWGCFGPCACPIVYQSPMAGGFVLRPSHVDPLYTYYDVLDVLKGQISDSKIAVEHVICWDTITVDGYSPGLSPELFREGNVMFFCCSSKKVLTETIRFHCLSSPAMRM